MNWANMGPGVRLRSAKPEKQPRLAPKKPDKAKG